MTCKPDKHNMVSTFVWNRGDKHSTADFCTLCGTTKEAMLEAEVLKFKTALMELAPWGIDKKRVEARVRELEEANIELAADNESLNTHVKAGEQDFEKMSSRIQELEEALTFIADQKDKSGNWALEIARKALGK